MVSVLASFRGLCGHSSCRLLMVTPAFRRNPEVALREHLSLACEGGHIREVFDRSYSPHPLGDIVYNSEVDV
jgi:hypothetical protein